MKLSIALKSFAICFLATLNLQAQHSEQIKRYYKKIQGLYQDPKTNEVVLLPIDLIRFRLYYQPNPYCVNAQVKAMKQTSLDVNKNRMQVQFVKSNYRCTFIFDNHYQSFVCINPDGSQQIFKRTPQLIQKPFAYFLSLFPKHSTKQYHVSSQPTYTQALPLLIAWRFISHQKFHLFDDFTAKDRKDFTEGELYRLLLSTPQAPSAGYSGHTTYYVVKRFSLHPNFYSLLIREKGYAYGGESNYDITFLFNFDKTGKVLDVLKVGGIEIGMGHFELHTSSLIKGLQITVQDKNYNGPKSSTKKPKIDITQHVILPSGKFEQK